MVGCCRASCAPRRSAGLRCSQPTPLHPPPCRPHHPFIHPPQAGDIHRYDQLCTKHASLLNAQPALVAHERRLREKITILCLMELVGSLPPERRTVPLASIADATKLPLDGVEFLLMKAGAGRGARGALAARQ